MNNMLLREEAYGDKADFKLKYEADSVLDNPNNSFLRKWLHRTWKQRAVIVPFTLHVMDTATDVGVLYQWYSAANSNFTPIVDDRGQVSLLALANFSVCACVVYRVASSVAVYRVYRESILETMLQ
ncbi:hypothetical protein RFI_28809, partial [Reticulomyxa filosa]